jgi:aspartate/methionine/tyrosine aminotransferase
MIPVPQYPIYSALITLYGGQMVNYYLDEEKNWALNSADLQKEFAAAKEKGVRVKAITVINPGNPTG